MEKFKLPKEFAEKWLAALRSREYKQGDETLLSYEYIDGYGLDISKKSYCCLGVACALIEVPERYYSGESFVSEDSGVDIEYMLKEGYPKELIGEEDLPYILASLNDGIKITNHLIDNYFSEIHFRKPLVLDKVYKLSFPEIADFIEDNVEFY